MHKEDGLLGTYIVGNTQAKRGEEEFTQCHNTIFGENIYNLEF